MRCEFLIDKETVTAELTQLSPGKFQVEFEGRTYRLDHQPGSLLLWDGDGRCRSVEYVHWLDQPGVAKVALAGTVVPVSSKKRGGRAGAAGLDGTVKAPMNGQVVKILAEPGKSVEEGQVVLTLEAMKMENEVTAPLAGTLVEVAVEVGQSVEPGKLLFRVEGKDGAGSDEPSPSS